MKTIWGWGILFLALALVSLGQSQCQFPVAPFDATGTYVGTWSGEANDSQEGEDCPLTLELEHDPTLPFPRNLNFTGTATIDFSCIELPEGADPLEANTVNLNFFLSEDGQLSTLAGGLGPGVSVFLGLNGQGEDLDADGFMDRYSGDWTYVLVLAIPNADPFRIDGTFEVEAVQE